MPAPRFTTQRNGNAGGWLSALLFLAVVHAASAEVVVKPYFVRENGLVSMILRLTNDGAGTIKVPTEGYSLTVTDTDGLQVGILFAMPSYDQVADKWAYIPSVQRIAPVELRAGEHAAVSVPLIKSSARKLLDPAASYGISYTVTPEFAARFGLWSGTAKIGQQPSPYKENSTVVMLADDGSSDSGATSGLGFLPAVSVPGLGISTENAINIDPSKLPKIGDIVTVHPGPGGSLNRIVTGEFGGVAGSMVTIGNRRYYLPDIAAKDRQLFIDYMNYHRN